MILDPAVELLLKLGFLSLFFLSLTHKALNFTEFEATVANYQKGLYPNWTLTLPLSLVIIFMELLIVMSALLISDGIVLGCLAAGMLVLYALAMAINLLRGNRMLDCGCTWGTAKQPVGYELVIRNLVLALFALLLTLPVEMRPLHLLDYFSVFAALLLSAVLYTGINQMFVHNLHN